MSTVDDDGDIGGERAPEAAPYVPEAPKACTTTLPPAMGGGGGLVLHLDPCTIAMRVITGPGDAAYRSTGDGDLGSRPCLCAERQADEARTATGDGERAVAVIEPPFVTTGACRCTFARAGVGQVARNAHELEVVSGQRVAPPLVLLGLRGPVGVPEPGARGGRKPPRPRTAAWTAASSPPPTVLRMEGGPGLQARYCVAGGLQLLAGSVVRCMCR
mmetsp:Transcript_113382/g.196520  ORF Transcript_113382/g.196520 Transcript_113382/m.196520 type:complete len:216 (-) Transcript_113382:887-1534(-)